MKRSLLFASTQSHTKVSVTLATAKIWAMNLLRGTGLIHKTPQKLAQSRRKEIDPASLQFRLTVGVTACSVLGLGGVAAWTSWEMQRILITTHTENVELVADRIPRDVELYSEMFPVEMAVEKTIDKLSSSSLLIWMKGEDNGILAQSQTLQTAPSRFTDQLHSLSEMPLQPRVYQVGERFLVLCSSPLVVNGTTLGQLYIAQDITEQQLMLTRAIRGLSIVTFLAVVLLAILLTCYIRRSLKPLRNMSQLAGTISANDLSQTKLPVHDAPTEVKELTEKLNEMLSRLAQSWDQQRQLIGNISHELRTPLSVVYGYLQSIQRRSDTLKDTQREALDIAISETDRTIRLLQSLLDLARADSGCMYFHPEPFVLNDLITDLVRIYERINDRVIAIETASNRIHINTDRDCLNQALMQLLDNATKYSDPEKPIVIKLSQTTEHTTIQVCDRGCGIPLEQQSRIFDRFYRVDNARSRSTGGVGLGLAIAKILVEGMGGHISVSSQSGEGSTFTITLPNRAMHN